MNALLDQKITSAAFNPEAEPPSVVPFRIEGADHQFVVFSLDPDDELFCEPAAFMMASGKITIGATPMTKSAESVFGLLLTPLRWLMQMVGRVASGERAWAQHIIASVPAEVALTNSEGGQIRRLTMDNGVVTLARGRWIAHTGNMAIQIALLPGIGTAALTQAPLWWQRMSGTGDVFFGAIGRVVETVVAREEQVLVDGAHLIAWQGNPHFAPRYIGSIRGALFAAEGVGLLSITGPARLYLDSQPLRRARSNRLAKRSAQEAA